MLTLFCDTFLARFKERSQAILAFLETPHRFERNFELLCPKIGKFMVTQQFYLNQRISTRDFKYMLGLSLSNISYNRHQQGRDIGLQPNVPRPTWTHEFRITTSPIPSPMRSWAATRPNCCRALIILLLFQLLFEPIQGSSTLMHTNRQQEISEQSYELAPPVSSEAHYECYVT